MQCVVGTDMLNEIAFLRAYKSRINRADTTSATMQPITEQDWKSIELTLALTILSVSSLFLILLVMLILLLRRYYRRMKRFNRVYMYRPEKSHYAQVSSPDSYEKRFCDTMSMDLDTFEHRASMPVNSQKLY